MNLRLAGLEDWKLLLDWRNDPITRQNSIYTDVVSENTHKNWFTSSLTNPNIELFIFEDNFVPVGTIRCDFTDNRYFLLSWNVSPEHRGKGYGTRLLKVFLKDRKGLFVAKIKQNNLPSIKMVEKNGFTLHERTDLLVYIKEII